MTGVGTRGMAGEALGEHKWRVVNAVPWVEEGVETFELSLERKVQVHCTENRGKSIPWGKRDHEQKKAWRRERAGPFRKLRYLNVF